MLIYNVFGRHIGVQRKNDRWLVFRADPKERKFSRLYDIAIPDDMTESEIAGRLADWPTGRLADIFQEVATERHPNVERIE